MSLIDAGMHSFHKTVAKKVTVVFELCTMMFIVDPLRHQTLPKT